MAAVFHRFARGVVQGCPFSTFAAVLPTHLALHEVHKQHKAMRSVSIADDSYFGAPVGALEAGFAAVRATHAARCNLHSNVEKLKAFVPSGGTDGIPTYVLDQQGGEVLGFKCGGSYVAANTPQGDAWRIEKLKDILDQRLNKQAAQGHRL